jgi:hypothetical protein
MKIRIKGDSIRFRLTQTEVKELSENGEIYDSTNFGNLKLSYSVVLNKNIDNLNVRFENNGIILEMPVSIGKYWYTNDIITFDHNFITSKKNELYLLLEKDFTCLNNTIEEQLDNYPNPKLN